MQTKAAMKNVDFKLIAKFDRQEQKSQFHNLNIFKMMAETRQMKDLNKILDFISADDLNEPIPRNLIGDPERFK